MSDLIDRQKAIERIVSIRPSTPKQSDYSHGVDVGMAMAIVAIKEQPSTQPEPSQVARDICTILENELDMRVILKNVQSEIIHCGDCRYKDDGIDEDGIPFLKCLNGRSYGGTRINDFCSWAERRTDERPN